MFLVDVAPGPMGYPPVWFRLKFRTVFPNPILDPQLTLPWTVSCHRLPFFPNLPPSC